MNGPVPQSEASPQPSASKGLRQKANPSEDKTQGKPGVLWSVILLVWLVRLSALINLVSALLPTRPRFIHWLGPWMPFEISDGIRIRLFLTSILLFILASGLARGKRTAWLLTIATLAIAPMLHLGRVTIWPQALINLGLIVFLLLHFRFFRARSDRESVRSAILICSILAVTLLAFGTVRLHELRAETSGDDDWGACLQTAFELVLVQNTQTQQAQTTTTLNFFRILRIGGITTALVGLFLTMRPVLMRERIRGDYREKVKGLIDRFGLDPFDSYALLDDKSYFFSGEDQAMVPYVLSGNFAIALADPIGHPDMRSRAIVDFASFCRRQDWEPVFYATSSELIAVYEQQGLSLFKIGEGARLRASEFKLKGGDFQNLRTICHKAVKLGIRFCWYCADNGIDEALEQQLASVSRHWLEAKQAREMSFDMGAYSVDDIRKNGTSVAVDAHGNALAFATWRPFAQGKGMALDLMRALPEARNIMDFVLVESIFHFRRQGIDDISLGLAPLANLKESTSHFIAEERMVQFLFENLNHVYGYKSLYEFKRKYRPQWRGAFVAYRRGVHLPLMGLALARVHAPKGLWKFFATKRRKLLK